MANQSSWRKEMLGIYREARRTRSDDMTGFYLKLEQVSKKYMGRGEMQEGDSFQFALSTGGHFAMRFYKDSSEVGLLDDKFREIKKLISRENSARKEYNALEVTSAMLKASNGHIGEQYPIELFHVLEEIKPGQIISFVDGHSYACVGNERGNALLADIFDGDIENFSLKAIRKKEITVVNRADPNSVQAFYFRNCKHLTERVEYTYSAKDDAFLRIKNIENSLRKDETKEINIAKLSIKATRNADESVSWHDSDGKKLSRDDVALVFGILNNHINKREYIRSLGDGYHGRHSGSDMAFEKHIEGLSAVHDTKKIAHELMEYARQSGKSLTIRQRLLGNGEEKPSDIIIQGNGAEVKAFRVTYTDNDFTKGVEKQEEIKEEIIAAELDNIYKAHHSVLKTRTEEELTQQVMEIAHKVTPVQHKIIAETAEKTAAKSAVILEKGDVRITSGDVANYLSGYIHNNEQEKNVTVEEIKETIKESAKTNSESWGKDQTDEIGL